MRGRSHSVRQFQKPETTADTVAHTRNSNTQEAEAGTSRGLGHPQLHNKSEATMKRDGKIPQQGPSEDSWTHVKAADGENNPRLDS